MIQGIGRKLLGLVLLACSGSVKSSSAQSFTVLATLNRANGAGPRAPLIYGSDGYFYGTAESGGADNAGTIFRVTSSGSLTTLHSFAGPDGSLPYAALVQGSDGNFYGTTARGGANGGGTVFRITPSGTFTLLHSFSGPDGLNPCGALIQTADGVFYGTTNGGTVFKITPEGALTTIYLGPNTAYAYAGLIPGGDGDFYGTTTSGGFCGVGTVYKITPSGATTELHSFGYQTNCNGVEGALPYAGLLRANDGNFYGTTSESGLNGYGTIYRITPSGTFTTLHSFAVTEGAVPFGALMQATDGNIYGTTDAGGPGGAGIVFKMTLSGTVTTVHSFSSAEGGSNAALIQAAGGVLYGITGAGTVFSLTLPPGLPPIPSIIPGGVVPLFSSSTTIQPGEWVSIYGTNLASSMVVWNGDFPTSLGGTSVTINGRPAYLWFVSQSQINVQAPDDLAIGPVPVVVKTAGGTATSTVTLGQFGPSFSLLDTRHVTGIILRPDGSGNYGGGTYDIIGPTGTSFGYATVAARAGDSVEVFGVGFGPTNPAVMAGKAFVGSAPTVNPVALLINNVSVLPASSGMSGAGLYQINFMIPQGLGTGDLSLTATVGGVPTPSGVVISLR